MKRWPLSILVPTVPAQIVRVTEGGLFPIDSLKDTVRLGACCPTATWTTPWPPARWPVWRASANACAASKPDRVRVVGTNTLRVANHAEAFIAQAEALLGFPVEIIAGRERARLIYLGAAHSLPLSPEKRLVVDIGGSSRRVYHRPGHAGPAYRKPDHGLCQLQLAVLPGRAHDPQPFS